MAPRGRGAFPSVTGARHAAAAPTRVINSRRFMSDNGPSSSPVPMRAKTAAAAVGLPTPAYRGMADRSLGQYLNCSESNSLSRRTIITNANPLMGGADQGCRRVFNALDAGAILTFSLLRRRLQWQALIRSKLMNSWRIGATA
jgi:hypothetical protein